LISAAGANYVALALVEKQQVQHVLLMVLHPSGQLPAAAAAVLGQSLPRPSAAAAGSWVNVLAAAQLGVLPRVQLQKLPDLVALQRPAAHTVLFNALGHLALEN
jgi:hypothetical protein